ncbi:hypothetical protein CR513_53383, partial [Mucuna pruriens]
MAEDKVITLGPNELPNLVSSYRLESRNYLQWARYTRTTLKGRKKLSHIEGNSHIEMTQKTRRSVMLDKGNSNTGSAMVTGKDPIKRSTFEEKPFTKSSHGEYSSTQMWVNQTTFNKENEVEHPSISQLDQDIQAFSKEEMDRLRALLNSTSKHLGSCGLTMNGKSSFNISSSVPQSIWILDSRATDHMTTFPSHFASYLKVPKRQLINVTNGDHVPIVGSGNVSLHSSLSLHNVLHVPKLANNLIYIHRLIQYWNCAVTFFHSHCVIQELTKERTIGVAKERGGLYYLQHTKIGNNTNKKELPSSQWATSETWTASQIWLYHKRDDLKVFDLYPVKRILETV